MVKIGNIGHYEMDFFGSMIGSEVIDEMYPGTSPPPAPASEPSDPAEGATSSISHTLDDAMQGAHIEAAAANISVSPAGWIKLGDVAEVRKGDATGEFIIDFQSLRTVTGIAYNKPDDSPVNPLITSYRVWTGTEFADSIDNPAAENKHQLRFSEVLTERVQVIFSGATDLTADMVRANGTANLPSPPADLELKLGNLTIWAHPRAVKLDENGVFTEEVDITADLTKALAGGTWPIDIRLKASVPGLMQLANQITFQRKHTPSLPGGSILVDADQVGLQTVGIPLPSGSADWEVHAVEMTVGGDVPGYRVLPAESLSASDQAQLILDKDHVVILGIPSALRKQFKDLEAVQLSLDASEGDAEVAGVIYLGDEAQPTAKTAAVAVMPSTLDQHTGYRWIELSLSDALAVDSEDELWLEVNVSRGCVRLPLATGSAPEGSTVIVRRGVPGGPYEDFRAKVNGSAFAVTSYLRVKGNPFKVNGVPALIPGIKGISQVFDGFTPDDKGTSVRLDPDVPATATTGSISDDSLSVELQIQAPGSYRISDLTIFYTIGST